MFSSSCQAHFFYHSCFSSNNSSHSPIGQTPGMMKSCPFYNDTFISLHLSIFLDQDVMQPSNHNLTCNEQSFLHSTSPESPLTHDPARGRYSPTVALSFHNLTRPNDSLECCRFDHTGRLQNVLHSNHHACKKKISVKWLLHSLIYRSTKTVVQRWYNYLS